MRYVCFGGVRPHGSFAKVSVLCVYSSTMAYSGKSRPVEKLRPMRLHLLVIRSKWL